MATQPHALTPHSSNVDQLGRYPAYRDARVSWIGEIPIHWRERRAKYFFREVDERSATGKEELLSVSHTTGVTPRSQKNVTMFKAESYIGHKLARPNDIVVNTMWAWMAALGVSKNVGIVSSSYGVYRPLRNVDFLPTFVDYLLRIPPFKWEYICRSTGIRASRLRLYPDKFLDIALPCPPWEEQKSMVAFLQAKDIQIRRLIRNKRRLSEIASDRLKLATDEATRSPGVRQVRLEVATELMCRSVDRLASETYTPIGLFNRGRGMFHKPVTPGDELGDSDFFWVKSGDLILSGQFAWEGAVALAGEDDDGCIASHRYPVLRGKEAQVDTAYMLAFFRSDYGQLLLDVHSRGAAGRNRPLNIGSLMKETVPIPSDDAQTSVRHFVELEASIRRTFRAELAALMEYRERLITDVVTGKLDVREVQIPSTAREIEDDTIDESEADDETALDDPTGDDANGDE